MASFLRNVFVMGLIGASVQSLGSSAGSLIHEQLEHDGMVRDYYVHVPSVYDSTKPVPLVLVFHGGGGTAEQFARFTGFGRMAEKHGFIAVFPQGVRRQWYDDRLALALGNPRRVDDVGFVPALLKKLKDQYAIDASRVYATGMSNGGIFSQQLAIKASEHFAAVASVAAQIPAPTVEKFAPKERISVLLMNGTEDPLVPYRGGEITIAIPALRRLWGGVQKRGEVISTDKTIQMWIKHNGLPDKPTVETLPDRVLSDGCTVERSVWKEPSQFVSVELYKIIGGGHTYPGGLQYLPEERIGKTCRDFNATEVIWDFFERHPRLSNNEQSSDLEKDIVGGDRLTKEHDE